MDMCWQAFQPSRIIAPCWQLGCLLIHIWPWDDLGMTYWWPLGQEMTGYPQDFIIKLTAGCLGHQSILIIQAIRCDVRADYEMLLPAGGWDSEAGYRSSVQGQQHLQKQSGQRSVPQQQLSNRNINRGATHALMGGRGAGAGAQAEPQAEPSTATHLRLSPRGQNTPCVTQTNTASQLLNYNNRPVAMRKASLTIKEAVLTFREPG